MTTDYRVSCPTVSKNSVDILGKTVFPPFLSLFYIQCTLCDMRYFVVEVAVYFYTVKVLLSQY